MNNNRFNFDIVIIGGGLVGLTLVNLIRQVMPEKRIALVEVQDFDGKRQSTANLVINKERVDQYQLRVSAITPASEQLFKTLKIWSNLLPFATPFTGMAIRESDGTGQVELDSAMAGEPRMGHIIENKAIELSLLDAMTDESRYDASKFQIFSPAKIEAISSVEKGRRQLYLDTEEILSAELVIASDGAHSPTRQLLDIPIVEWSYRASSIVATVKTARPHCRVARQVFTSEGPLAFLPLGNETDSCLVSLVWSLESESAKKHLALSEDEFKIALARVSGYWLGKIETISDRKMLPLSQRYARNYIVKGVALVGDAAHVIHPLAGQGVNLGFADIAVLVETLVKADQSNLALGEESVLRQYERRRKGANLTMMASVEVLKRLYEVDSMPIRVIRNWGMRKVNRLDAAKEHLMRIAMGRSGDIPSYMENYLLI